MVDFVPYMETITASYPEGGIEAIDMHDGSTLQLRKLAKDWDPHDRLSAMNAVKHAQARGEILTGLLFIDDDRSELHEILGTADAPLNTLREAELCPGSEALAALNEGLR
jgi:2-oxoglutarate ferredoxin oxidoreductase subunit beta